MKKSLLLLALVSFGASAAELPVVPVGPMDFNNLSVKDSLGRIVAGTGVKLKVTDAPQATINAKAVAGSFPDVLKKFVSDTGMTYTYENGLLLVQGPATTWKLKRDEKISDVLSKWASKSDWVVVWDAPEISSGIDVTLNGRFDESVTKLIDALNRNGAGISATFYENNLPKPVLRITEKR